MIALADAAIRDVLLHGVAQLADSQQILFWPPDARLRNHMSSLSVDGTAVSGVGAYLVDLRENERLRSTEQLRRMPDGTVVTAPRRVDCHYLITAWSPAKDRSVAIQQEHTLLYEVADALMRRESVPLSTLFPGPTPSEYAEIGPLVIRVLPPEGFGPLSEFWGSMRGQGWRPVVYAIVTIPLLPVVTDGDALLTTRIIEYRHGSDTAVRIHIAGRVVADGEPVEGALVRIASGGRILHETHTTADGAFDFVRLEPGPYQLTARIAGRPDLVRTTFVPSPSGEYDLVFT